MKLNCNTKTKNKSSPIIHSLSIPECSANFFCRSLNPVRFDFICYNVCLQRVSSVKDLGVWIDDEVCFTLHENKVISKAYGTLGCLRCIGSEFLDPTCLKALILVVRLERKTEFGRIVLSTSSPSSILRLERVQKAFTRFAIRRIFGPGHELSPYVCLQFLGLESIESRRTQAQSLFITSILFHAIDTSPLLFSIDLYVPARPLRHCPRLAIP